MKLVRRKTQMLSCTHLLKLVLSLGQLWPLMLSLLQLCAETCATRLGQSDAKPAALVC